jgi:hypothetical protein
LPKQERPAQHAAPSRQPSPIDPHVERQYVFAWPAPRTQYAAELQQPPFGFDA